MPSAPDAPPRGASAVMAREHTGDADSTRRVQLGPSGLPCAMSAGSDARQAAPFVDALSAPLAATGAEAAAHARALLAAARDDAGAAVVIARARVLSERQRSRFAAPTCSDFVGDVHADTMVSEGDAQQSGGAR